MCKQRMPMGMGTRLMLRVKVDINGEVDIATLAAVRTHPKTDIVKDGTMCSYDIYFQGEQVGYTRCIYGNGIELAIQLLELYKKNTELFKTMVTVKKIRKAENELNKKNDSKKQSQ